VGDFISTFSSSWSSLSELPEEDEEEEEDSSVSSFIGFGKLFVAGLLGGAYSSSELELEDEEDEVSACLLFLLRVLFFRAPSLTAGGMAGKRPPGTHLDPTISMSKRKLAALQDGNEPRYFYTSEISNMVRFTRPFERDVNQTDQPYSCMYSGRY